MSRGDTYEGLKVLNLQRIADALEKQNHLLGLIALRLNTQNRIHAGHTDFRWNFDGEAEEIYDVLRTSS